LKTERTKGVHEAGLMPPDTFARILDLYFGGEMEASVGLAGQTAGLIDEVKPVRRIIEETIDEFFAVARRLGALGADRSFG
jgi:enoyl-[acyl-carrier protein] reductase II